MNKFLKILAVIVCLSTITSCASKPKVDYDIGKGTIDLMVSSSTITEIENPKPDESTILDSEDVSSENTSSDKINANSSDINNSNQNSSSNNSQNNSADKSSSIEVSSEISVSISLENSKSSSTISSSSKESSVDEDISNVVVQSNEKRAIWISYLDFYTLLKDKSEAQFRTNIKQAFNNITSLGLNTVIVQVRPFSDALYYSDIFPMSHIITGVEGDNCGFDPLEIMVTYAHSYGLSIEAWINPYRIRNSGTKAEVSSDNPAYKWLKNGDLAVVKHDGGISYNPGSEKARNLIVDGVAEIVNNYDIDGIHFDDYFYPTTSADFDSSLYSQYKQSGGKLSLDDFRRDNVNKLVKEVYSTIKSINSNVTFGISPQGNFENNYNKQYIDIDEWLTNKGYVDYICPQIYFGFKNSEYPFSSTVKAWNDKIRVNNIKLYVGLSPYKIGVEDKWAGEGKNEWENSSNMLQRMVLESRKQNKYEGFFMYRYGSLINPSSNVQKQVNTEIENLKTIF